MAKKTMTKEVKQDKKEVTIEQLARQAIMWDEANRTATRLMINQQQYSSMMADKRVQLREPQGMHFTHDGNKVTCKLMKASAIYDAVTPKNERYTFNDADYNPYANTPSAIPPSNYFNNLNSLVINNFFIGYGELSLIAQNPIISNGCEMRANEMVRKWVKLVSTDEIDRTKEIKAIENWFVQHKIKDLFRKCFKLAFQFGGCILYPKLKGDDKEIGGAQERSNPLMLDKLQISKGDVEYLTIVEPVWYTAVNWQSFDPLKPDFYNPSKYTILGRLTHATRFMHFKYKEVPDILKPTYLFNGQPLAQEVLPYLMGYEQSRNNINQLVAKYNHFVLKTDIEALLNDSDSAIACGQNLAMRLAMFTKTASTTNVIALDMESEDFANITLSLSGIDEVMNQNMTYVASIFKIPVTKIFQNALKGMNPTGEFEMNSFHDTIREDQVVMGNPQMDYTLKLCQLDLFGEIYDNIGYEWEPLEAANELELSQIALNKAQESVAYITSGVMTPENVAQRLQTAKDSGWDGIEIESTDYVSELDNTQDVGDDERE